MSPLTPKQADLLVALKSLVLDIEDHFPSMPADERSDFLDFVRQLHDVAKTLLATIDRVA